MYFAVFSGIEPDKSPNVTLKVFLDDGSGNHVNVPVTQETTCQEVALCVQHPGYETAHLTYVYKGQDQLLDGRENLYKLLQQWGKQKDEILFFLRRGPQPPSIPPPPPQPPEYYLRRTIIPENYPDQERGIPYQNYPDDGRIHLQEKYQEEELAFPEKYIDVDPTVLRRSIVHTPPPFEQDSFIHYPALDTDEGHLNVFHSNNPNEFQERNQPLAEVYHGTWAEEHNGILQDYPDQGITIATAKPVAVVPTPDLVPTDTQEGENYYYKEESSDTDYIVPSVGDVSSVNPESNGVVEDEEEDAGGYGSNENLDPCIGENVSEDGVLEEDEESGRRGHQRNGMREVPPPPRDLTPARTNGLPGGVDLTLTELQDMASRQQQQIESQQQVLVAKEQRLKYLKQQEQRQQQVAAENDRLRKLREKVESQEMKLKKLRALRGEVEKHQMSNGTLNTELESVKALFTEKEKELVMAVAKVEELTRQLEQIRQERANVKNGSQSSAALELEKLRKELMIRNKVNEQQNAKLNVHKEMLNQRKGEVANMDNRIHELQQRLKKKRAQQAENVKNGGNKKNDSNRNSNRPSKVAAVEPYIQYKPAKESVEQDLKSGFHKQDPNYQSLPPNLKFPQQENSRVEDTKGLKEQNNNSEKQNLTKPGSVTDNSKCISNGSLVNQVSDSIIRAAQRHQVVPGGATVRGPSNSGKPPPPPLPVRSATTGLTHLTPRPFGSTYSTTVLGNNKGHNQSSQQNPNVNGPSINVQEDVRQGGSGQSSPASSDSSLKENTFPSENMKHLPNVPNSAPPRPNLRRKLPSPEPNMSSGRPNQSHDQVDATRPLHSNSNTKSQKSVTNSAAAFTEQNGANGNVNTNTSAKGASSKQIANLYMGRLGKGGSQKFQDSLNILYKNASDEKSSNVEGKERIIDNSVKSATNQRVPSPDTSPSAIPPPSPPKSSHHQTFTPPGSPNYPDIASDKASHNRHGHTPKGIRRRHSDSDNEDTQNIAKLMHKHNLDRHNIHHSQNNAYSDRPALLAETQATSFIGGIPENVPVDSLGNLVEISDNNESGQNDNSSSSNSSNVVVSPVSTDIKVTGGAVKGKKTNLRRANSKGSGNRVSFDPLALLLDASLEGELELVKRCASQVQNVSESNDEGITALHNAICAGHYDIVTFLVEFGCDVNSPDSDGWTPLHCAASCNNLPMVIFLVEHGACIFATTISDHETAAEKCEEDEDGYDGCSEYLYSVQEKLGILNGGVVYAVFDYEAQNPDELGFSIGDEITVLKKGDESEKEWWWSKSNNKEGYIPRNLLGLYPRVLPHDYTPEC